MNNENQINLKFNYRDYMNLFSTNYNSESLLLKLIRFL